ncbi:MAG: hypothetical protein R3Y35_12675 [Clostridia bacterium]
MKKNRIIAGVLSLIIVTGTVVGLALSSQNDTEIEIEPTPSATVEPTEEPEIEDECDGECEDDCCTDEEQCEDDCCTEEQCDDECCNEEVVEPTIEPTTSPTTEPTVEPTTSPTSTPTDESSTTSHTHDYTVTVTKEATETSTGIRTYTCSCGYTFTETIPKIETEDSSDDSIEVNTNNSLGATIPTSAEEEALLIFESRVAKGCSVCGSTTCATFNYDDLTVDSSRCDAYSDETNPAIYCQICGKENGNGTNGTCCTPMWDTVCYYCGESIKAGECHTCGQ